MHGLWPKKFISRLGVVDFIVKLLKIYCDKLLGVFFFRYANITKHMKVKYLSIKKKTQK